MDKVPMNKMQVYAVTLLCIALGVGVLSTVTLILMNPPITFHVFLKIELILWAIFSVPYALFQLYDWVKTL